MTKEIHGESIVVLPILIENCDIPIYLKDKLYADLREFANYDKEFKKLVLTIRRFDKKNIEKVEKKIDILISDSYGRKIIKSILKEGDKNIDVIANEMDMSPMAVKRIIKYLLDMNILQWKDKAKKILALTANFKGRLNE